MAMESIGGFLSLTTKESGIDFLGPGIESAQVASYDLALTAHDGQDEVGYGGPAVRLFASAGFFVRARLPDL